MNPKRNNEWGLLILLLIVALVAIWSLFSSGNLQGISNQQTNNQQVNIRGLSTQPPSCGTTCVGCIRDTCRVSTTPYCRWANGACRFPTCGNLIHRIGKDTPQFESGCFSNGPPPNQGWVFAGTTSDCGSVLGRTNIGCFFRSFSSCTPNCNGKNCGDNGCGGSCGTCGSGQTCQSGQCVAQAAPGCSDTSSCNSCLDKPDNVRCDCVQECLSNTCIGSSSSYLSCYSRNIVLYNTIASNPTGNILLDLPFGGSVTYEVDLRAVAYKPNWPIVDLKWEIDGNLVYQTTVNTACNDPVGCYKPHNQYTTAAYSDGAHHTVRVTVDPANIIPESNENDNVAVYTFVPSKHNCGARGQVCCPEVGNKCDNGGDGTCRNNICT